ncbi:MAG: DUF975 family protein [bacterium]
MTWYYAKSGVRHGPVTDVDFRALAASGKIQPADLVWTEEFGAAWRMASTVPDLVFAAHVIAPPPPPKTVADNPANAEAYTSSTPNRELMSAARLSLQGNWGLAIGVTVVIGLIQVALSLLTNIPLIGLVFSLGSLLISGALALGIACFWISLSRTGSGSMSQAFSGFERFGTAFLAYLLMGIFIFLWWLLLVVPGIIAAYRYSQTWYVLADNPQMDALDAIRCSKQIMRGNKWKLFCLHWRFFGWILLCLLTCGIGFLWLGPYMSMSAAKFYEDLKPA